MERVDGRRFDELRPIKIEAGVLKRADGSCYIEWGKNKIYAAVYGPKKVLPRHLEKDDRAILRCRYNMAPFSVEERKRPGPDRRAVEIGKVMQGALEPAILMHYYPKSMIEISVEVVQANAGTRCAGITAVSVALADAGIPMRDLVPSCAAGKVDGQVILDLAKEEDNSGEADMPVAIIPRLNQITLLQMDGKLTEQEVEQAITLAMQGCQQVYQLQIDALRRKYAGAEYE
ncbi:MAG: exosome complex exonuclease Rrp41 [Theionarchaea archaeon]|nr:exosome complex exonuclease Rrp41 [Theionarchaea archaeon]MBU6999861.1 exosome complex exonuclease Rrp41 [Theionarchaea archaeon]MBU7020051.1 exosome complex exonuclease Rrp41 [Theionarchaea archaeon]MBU7034268.1 exosome complex exonuclease Rrp41 [Theionarchaea archaeon]MBU7039533.1 exosome complex exonuclease Rrp41 [Theionarchaea archaeon]